VLGEVRVRGLRERQAPAGSGGGGGMDC
jgi:hypothetical protein